MGLFDLFRRPAERRKNPRHTVIATAWIRLKDNPLPFVCVLWDVSEGGARLAVAKPEAVSDELNLVLDRDDTRGTVCRVIWRSKEQIGLQFVENAEPIRRLITQDMARVA